MIFGGLSTKITKEEQRSCKGVYFAKFDAPEVKKKCQIEGIIAFLRSNILKVANYMTSLNIRALVRTGATGAAAPINFGQRVHAPFNFHA